VSPSQQSRSVRDQSRISPTQPHDPALDPPRSIVHAAKPSPAGASSKRRLSCGLIRIGGRDAILTGKAVCKLSRRQPHQAAKPILPRQA